MGHPRNSKEAAKAIRKSTIVAIVIVLAPMIIIITLNELYDFTDASLVIASSAFSTAILGVAILAYASSYQLEFGSRQKPNDG